jgi:hypothetical protein
VLPRSQDESGRSYTWPELVAEAHRRGLAASRALIRDWVQLGLLDRPTPGRGLGRGRGRTLGTWSPGQRELFLEMLWQRQRAPAPPSIGALSNLPVWLWLTGRPAVESLSQVRRALATWATAPRRVSDDAVIADATRAVRRFARPGASRRARLKLRLALTDLATGGEFEPTWLLERVAAVTDGSRRPEDESSTGDGPTPGRYVARQWALRVTEVELALLTDETLEGARTYYRTRLLTDNPRLPSSACRNLVLIARLLSLDIGVEAWSGRRVPSQ